MTALVWTCWALAADPHATVTEEGIVRYWIEEERLPSHPDVPVFNYLEQVNRLSAVGQGGAWKAWFQLDQVSFSANRYYLDDVLYEERPLTVEGLADRWPGSTWIDLEKLSFTRDQGWGQVTFGDHYAVFGRGGALNLNRNVDLDVDTSVRGVKVMARPGSWDLTASVGQLNRAAVWLMQPNGAIDLDRRHSLAALRAERFGIGPFNLGFHETVWQFVDEGGTAAGLRALSGTPDAWVSGMSADAPGLAGMDWYLEANHFYYASEELFGGDEPSPGRAIYGSLAGYWGPVVWLLEAKDYRNAERINAALGREYYEVAVAPTLEYERATNEDSAAAVNSNDITGARLRADWAASSAVIPYASFAWFEDRELGGLHFNRAPERISHAMTGVEWLQGHWALLFNAGLRSDRRVSEAEDYGRDQQIHADLDWKFPLGQGWLGNLSGGFERFEWGENIADQADYTEFDSAVSVQRGSAVALIAYLDHTSNPLVNTTGNLDDDLYGALELQVKPAPAVTTRFFYGATKAGIRCSGGQCRTMPGFHGARATVVATF